jgi:hypothetical protein
MKTYNNITIPDLIRTDRIVSAFCNPTNPNVVEDYTAEMNAHMLSHNFPPITGYPSIITEDDMENDEFGMMDLNSDDYKAGDLIWKVTDGHHRTLAAIGANLPHLEVELDYSCITNEKELY